MLNGKVSMATTIYVDRETGGRGVGAGGLSASRIFWLADAMCAVKLLQCRNIIPTTLNTSIRCICGL